MRSATLQPALAAFPGRLLLCHKLVDEFGQGSTAAAALGLKQQSTAAVDQETLRACLQLRVVRRHHACGRRAQHGSFLLLCACLPQHAHFDDLYCSAWPPRVSTAHLPVSCLSLYNKPSGSRGAQQLLLLSLSVELPIKCAQPDACTLHLYLHGWYVHCAGAVQSWSKLDPYGTLCSGAGPST